MGQTRRVWGFFSALALLATGCGGDDGAPEDSGPRDASADSPIDLDGGPEELPDAGPCLIDGAVLDCSHLDEPCQLGVCDPETGACIPVVLDEVPCDDGDGCTVGDYCVEGTCVSTPLECEPLSTECSPSVCDPDMGACVAAPLADGTACDDGTACTTTSACSSGACLPTAYLDCASVADACNAPSCDAMAGCAPRPLTGAPCDDGDGCTLGDACDSAGTCVGAPLGCAALAGPCRTGACDPTAGTCAFTDLADGTSCDDGNACTSGDLCAGGACTGTVVSCPGTDGCHAATCDPAGGCRVTTLPDGTVCDDGNGCTTADQCTAGSCAGVSLMCDALDDACNTGACDATTGTCIRNPRVDGTSCDVDADDCTIDACRAGACEPTNRAECTACGGPSSGLMCRSGVCDAGSLSEIEGFEGAVLPAAYSTSTTGWSVTATMSIEGGQAIRSGTIGNGQISEISRTVFSTWFTPVDFAFRVSTEESDPMQPGDALIFLVDSVEVQRWSGVRPWGRFSHLLYNPGPHVLTWRYEKDAAGTAGADAVFVDDVRISGLPSSVEDFESGALSGAFTTGGALPWRVVAAAASGTYGVRSGAITHSQSSWLRYSVTNDRNGQIGYAARTQSETNDELSVSIDGVEVSRISGNLPWFYWGHPLPAGTHTIEWRFTRDAAGSALANAVWIDDVFVVPDDCP